MKVIELATKEVVTISPDSTLADAAKMMRDHHVGDLIVSKPKRGSFKPLGILTDRDIVIGVVALGMDSSVLTAGDIMSPELFKVKESEDVQLVVEQMRKLGIRRAPVVDSKGLLSGIFTLDDYLNYLATAMLSVRRLIKRERNHEERTRLKLSNN